MTAAEIMANYAGVKERLWRPTKLDRVPARVRLARTAYSFPIGPTLPIRTGITTATILAAVCDSTGFKPYELCNPSRTQPIVRARYAGFLVARRKTRKSLPQIGMMFGGRDHTTVLHGIRKAEVWEAKDPKFAALVQRVTADVECRA